MKKHEIIEMMDSVEEYVKTATPDDMTGRMFRLATMIEKDVKQVPSALELILINAFLEERKDVE